MAATRRTAEIQVVDCYGTPRQRGEQHGEALRETIAAGLARWGEAIATTHGFDAGAYIASFVEQTDLLPAIRRWTPDLLEEIEGIARGAGQPWESIYAYNLLDEEWTYARSRRAGTAPGCTAAGFAPKDGAPVLAQTMDIPNVHDGTQAVLRVAADDGPAAMLLTFAGEIGLTGCNSEGLALVVNNLDMLPASASGLPVAFVIRGILARRTLAEAVSFVRDVPHATGQHYGIGSPQGLAGVEAWAGGAAVDRAVGERLLHTNHPLLCQETVVDGEPVYQRSQTRERLAYLEREADRGKTVAGLQELLRDRTVPVSRGADRWSMTFGAVVYECSAPAKMWVAPGPPHETPYVEMRW